ncbi:hypothetical protein [Mycobacterium shigaense]|uniref:bestrophin-like domain n=1 Tax=Mycobacterium shigaense TaxID=722731 RepID=UPI0013C2FB39|nr:hypothetical protein [Mycobacterium shigaense]
MALGLGIRRAAVRRGVSDNENPLGNNEGLGPAVGFISGSTAFLLGVLMLASLNHYDRAKEIVADEALAYSAAFDGTAGLAPADQAKIRRDLVCLMRSVTTKSWAAASTQDLTGSENSHAWRARAFDDLNAAEPKTKAQESSVGIVNSQLINASKAGQHRLLVAEGDLPTALWILVYVSIFALASMLTALLRDYLSPTLAAAALTALLIVSAAMVTTLTVFAEPFSQGDGVYISPRALNAVMIRLQGSYPDTNWAPCETLVNS